MKTKLLISVMLFSVFPILSFSQNIVKFDEWKPSEWNNSDLLFTDIVKNPVNDPSNNNAKTVRITKKGGENAKNSHNAAANKNVILSKNNCIFELKLLFLTKDNTLDATTLGLRMGNHWSLQVDQQLFASEKWQTVKFDFSQNPVYTKIFEQNRDTTVSRVSFFPRRDSNQDDNIILYVDELKAVKK